MTAKQAIFDELGDLFSSAEKNQPDRTDILVPEDMEFEISAEEEEKVSDVDDSALDAAVSGNQPPDLFDRVFASPATNIPENGEDGNAFNPKDMTDQELDACVEAAYETIATTKLPPSTLNWGLDYIQKMYDEQNARLEARIQNRDSAAAKALYAKEAEEEEAREKEEREKYIQS